MALYLSGVAKVLLFFSVFTAFVGVATLIPAIIVLSIHYTDATSITSFSLSILDAPAWVVIGAGAITFLVGIFCCYASFTTTPRSCFPTGCGITIIFLGLVLVGVSIALPLLLSAFLSLISDITSKCYDCRSTYTVCSDAASKAGASCFYDKGVWDSYTQLNNTMLGLTIADEFMLFLCFVTSIVMLCQTNDIKFPTMKIQAIPHGGGIPHFVQDRYGTIADDMKDETRSRLDDLTENIPNPGILLGRMDDIHVPGGLGDMELPHFLQHSQQQNHSQQQQQQVMMSPITPGQENRGPSSGRRHHHHHHHSSSRRRFEDDDYLSGPPQVFLRDIPPPPPPMEFISPRLASNDLLFATPKSSRILPPRPIASTPVMSDDKWRTLFPTPRT